MPLPPLLEPSAPDGSRFQNPGLARTQPTGFEVHARRPRTRMFVPAQEPPWRAIRAFQNPQRQAVVHLHNVSGGDSVG